MVKSMVKPLRRKINLSHIAAYIILIAWSAIVIFPVWMMIVNSFKHKRDIFTTPFTFPSPITLEGYQNALGKGRFDLYFRNSLIITIISLALILFLGSLAAYGIARWKSRTSNIIYFVFIAGLLIPIRLGTINIIQIVKSLGLIDNLLGLIPIYVATGVPIAILILTAFIRRLPQDLIDAARIDGASEWKTYHSLVLPLIRPALATVGIFNLIPVWNDFWFPLILIRSKEYRTVPLGVSLLFGQYQTNWTNILAALSLASIPIIILYILLSSQFIKGLTAGAVKG
jgi:raffinose/stachyose/melibiose transport system permease protein